MVFGGEHHVLLAGGAGQIHEGVGSNLYGLNRLGSSRYSASVMPPGLGCMIGHEASTLARSKVPNG